MIYFTKKVRKVRKNVFKTKKKLSKDAVTQELLTATKQSSST